MLVPYILSFTGLALASISVYDPSDTISPAAWAADNAIVPDYNVPYISSQPSALLAAYTFDENSTTIDHETYSTTLNDTSVILVADGAELNMSYITVKKFGYASNLLASSFYGFNAAINIANASTAYIENINVTVHNGAANIYVYGSDSVAHVDGAWLYSSGPVSHGVYASGNGTAYVNHVQHYSGGKRSSSFSGDSPAGYLHISNSVAHAAGIGSATFYALGEIYADNVVSISENGPVVFMDGDQKAYLTNCECTAGLLGGVAIFSSAVRQSGAVLSLTDTKITTTGADMPGLWFGNTIINVSLYNSELVTKSGILVVANFSQITQDFDYYADYAQQSNLEPAEVFVNVAESTLVGDLVAYNESYISWSLASYSSWTGAAYSGYGDAYFDVYLDHTSTWNLTKTTSVQNLTDEDTTLSNIYGGGYDIYYNSSALLNGYLGGKTISLAGGGSAIPA